MNEPRRTKPSSSIVAPAIGCVAAGFGIPLLLIVIGGDSSGWFGLPAFSFILAPIGILCGLLFNAWKNRNFALADPELVAELKSMSMESLLEYKGLCPQDSREYAIADAELARRRAAAGETPRSS